MRRTEKDHASVCSSPDARITGDLHDACDDLRHAGQRQAKQEMLKSPEGATEGLPSHGESGSAWVSAAPAIV